MKRANPRQITLQPDDNGEITIVAEGGFSARLNIRQDSDLIQFEATPEAIDVFIEALKDLKESLQ